MNNGKRFVPYWLRRAEEPVQQDVLLILDRCNAIMRRRSTANGDGDGADLEAARIDLTDTLEEIFQRGTIEESPLWAAVMMIRPQVINGRMATSTTEEVAQALWNIKKDAVEKEPAKAEFFGRLAGRLRKHQINFFRAVIDGGPLVAKEKDEWRTHYFPGIPFPVRTEAGVRLSTAPENIEAVKKAYNIMAGKTSGQARTAMEAIIADMEVLSERLYPVEGKFKI